MPKLAIYRGRQHLFDHWIRKTEIIIGRSADVDVPLDSPAASRRHCRIVGNGVKYYVEDLGGRNGVFLNGQAITGKQRLRNADSIAIADHVLLFQRSKEEIEEARRGKSAADVYRVGAGDVDQLLRGGKGDSFAVRSTVAATDAKATSVVGAEDLERMMAELALKQGAHLEVQGDLEHQRHPLTAMRYTVGFDDDAMITLPDRWIWPWGKRPVEIHNMGKGSFHLVRTSRWCSVKINDKSVGDPVELSDKDLIRIGPAKLRFLGPTKVAEVAKKRKEAKLKRRS